MVITDIYIGGPYTMSEIVEIIEFVADVAEPVADFCNDLFEAAVEYQDNLNEATGGDRDYTDVVDSASDMMWCNP